jgi:hypothetical protein
MTQQKEEVREVVISANEKTLRLMKSYLSYVVIIGLSWWVIHLDMQLERLRKEADEQKLEAIRFWREAYRKSSETYLLMIEKEREH